MHNKQSLIVYILTKYQFHFLYGAASFFDAVLFCFMEYNFKLQKFSVKNAQF